MNYILKSACFCLVLCGTAACNNESTPSDVTLGSGDPAILSARIEQPVLGRTSTGGADNKTTSWSIGDRVLLKGTASIPLSSGGNDTEDLGPAIYQYKGNDSWVYADGSTQPIVWRASTIQVSGVFPATDGNGDEVTPEQFTLGTDQQTAEKQGNNDYMVAAETSQNESANQKKVILTFTHQLAQLVIGIASIGTEFPTGTTVTKVEVRSNTVFTSSSWGTPAYITACGSATGVKDTRYIALVAPEKPTVDTSNPFIKVTLSNNAEVMLSSVPANLTFEKGKQHTLALHIGHDQITVDAGSIGIGGWGTDTNVTVSNPGDTDEQ